VDCRAASGAVFLLRGRRSLGLIRRLLRTRLLRLDLQALQRDFRTLSLRRPTHQPRPEEVLSDPRLKQSSVRTGPVSHLVRRPVRSTAVRLERLIAQSAFRRKDHLLNNLRNNPHGPPYDKSILLRRAHSADPHLDRRPSGRKSKWSRISWRNRGDSGPYPPREWGLPRP